MAYISSLKLKNFRTFRQEKTLTFSPLTIITGPNSSGKSSLFKALLLLQQNVLKGGLERLHFSGGQHNLGSFDAIRSHGAEEDEIGFSIGFDWGEYDEFHFPSLTEEEALFSPEIRHVHFDLVYRRLHNGLPLVFFRIRTGEHGENVLFTADMSSIINIPQYDDEGLLISAPPHLVYKTTIHGDWFFQEPEAANQLLGVSEYLAYEAEDAPRLLVGPLETSFNRMLPIQALILPLSLDQVVERAASKWNRISTGSETEIASTVRRVLENLYRPYIEKWVRYLEQALRPDQLEHTGTLRAESRRVYSTTYEQSSFVNTLEMYTDLRYATRSVLARKWLKKFGIGDSLKVEQVADAAYTVTIKKGDKTYQLADLGYGYTQLLPLIMRAVLNEPHFPTLLLEEPETNLHPNLQSELADLFVELTDKGKRLLVETHSEYLIRRLQYLVAKGACTAEKIVIYYLGPDPEADDYIKRITITETGQLSQEFGPGFYDEATNLMLDIFKYGSQN